MSPSQLTGELWGTAIVCLVLCYVAYRLRRS